MIFIPVNFARSSTIDHCAYKSTPRKKKQFNDVSFSQHDVLHSFKEK